MVDRKLEMTQNNHVNATVVERPARTLYRVVTHVGSGVVAVRLQKSSDTLPKIDVESDSSRSDTNSISSSDQ